MRTGRLPVGTTLPASRPLADDIGVSRGVVVRAYEQLTAEGYLVAQTGSGTVVGQVASAATTARRGVDRSRARNPGLPDLASFPRREWSRAVEQALTEMTDRDLAYGDARGQSRLREALTAYLGRTRAVVAPPDRIIVTTGYAQGCRLIAEALVEHDTGPVAVEDPGSVGVTLTMQAGGAQTVPIAVDQHGLDVHALAASPARSVVVTPAHQFPTGAVLSPQRRADLLAWAAAGGVVVEDDYDAEFRYDRSPVGALQGLAPDRVVYGGSVSKVLAPAIRLGWVVAPAWAVGTLEDLKFVSDVASPAIDQVALAILLESGAIDRHVRRVTGRYRERRARLLRAVERHLPGYTVEGVAAGIHAALYPPRGRPAPWTDAVKRGAAPVGMVPLADHYTGSPERPGWVVGYGNVTPDQIDRGIGGLARALGVS